MDAIKNRYDFVLFTETSKSRLNGDADTGAQRKSSDGQRALVSDVCLKHKMREWILQHPDDVKDLAVASAPKGGLDIFVAEEKALDDEQREAERDVKASAGADFTAQDLHDYACSRFFDVRTFGCVFTTGAFIAEKTAMKNVHGPVQLSFGETVSKVNFTSAATTNSGRDRGMGGEKNYIDYGLFRTEGVVSPALAKKTGFSEADLQLLFRSMWHMFEDAQSATNKGVTRDIVVFKHPNELGACPTWRLMDLVTVPGAESIMPSSDRGFKSYREGIKVDLDAASELGIEVLTPDYSTGALKERTK